MKTAKIIQHNTSLLTDLERTLLDKIKKEIEQNEFTEDFVIEEIVHEFVQLNPQINVGFKKKKIEVLHGKTDTTPYIRIVKKTSNWWSLVVLMSVIFVE